MMRKRKFAFLLTLALIVGSVSIHTSAEPAARPSLSAQSAILIDATHGFSLLEQNADLPLPMASTTKIMTALTALAHANPDAIVTVSADAVGVEGSSVYLCAGEELTLRDLLYALLLQSANDAAEAIAIAVGGSVSGFASLMNELAREWGLTNTHFENPHGLDSDGHYTTARELAIITRHALSDPLLREIVGTVKTTIPLGDVPDARLLVNHNKLLRTYEGAIGVKTGYTKRSGRCLVSAAERNGVTLIAVTLNDADDWRDHTAMLDYGFAQYQTVELCRAETTACAIPVTGGSSEAVDLRFAESLSIPLPNGHAPIGVTFEAPHFLYAPTVADKTIGAAVFSCDLNGDGSPEEIARIPLTVADTVPIKPKTKRSFWNRLKGR